MASNEQFMKFVNSELPKRISINNMPASGNLPAGKLLKTTGVGLNVELYDDNPLSQSLIAVFNNTANPIPLNKVLEVNGVPENSALQAIPSVKPIDNLAPDIPIGVLFCQLEDDLTTIKMIDADTKYGFLDPGKVGLAIKVGRAEIKGLNTSSASIGDFVYCDSDGDLTLTETVLKIGQVLSRGENGVIYVNIGALSLTEQRANGSIWISEISPQDPYYNAVVSEWEYVQDFNQKQVAAKGVANTYNIKAKVFAMSGSSHYKPKVTVNNVPVSLSPGKHPFEWMGEVQLTWTQETPYLVAAHEDGAKHIVAMVYEEGPLIDYVMFGGYPTFNAITNNGNETITQTEVKEGDIVNVTVKLSSSSSKPAYFINIGSNASIITLQDACKQTVFDISSNPMLPGETRTFQVRIANRGNVVQNLGTKAVAITQYGSYGQEVSSLSSGNSDGINYLKCNNTRVSIETLEIQYPQQTIGQNNIVQKAMKQNESTTWQCRFNNAGVNPIIRYEILNTNHLIFDEGDAFTFEKFDNNIYEKDFYCIASDVFNISLHNVAVHVIRRENGAYSTKTELLKIADKLAIIKITEEYERLRADFTPEGKLTYVKIISDQPLFEAPSCMFDTSMVERPIWNGDWIKEDADGYVWKRYFNVKTTTSKGMFYWRDLIAKNYALKVTNEFKVGGADNNTYTIGGFIKKEIQIPAWAGSTVPIAIGIEVSDVNKLQCTNLSKGASDSHNYTYQSFSLGTNVFSVIDNLTNLDFYVNKYTMTDQNGYIVNNPTHWVNLDIRNAASNTTGEMKIELEEII